RQVRPTLVDRIQDRYGRTIWRHDERDCRGCRSERPGAEPDLPDSRRQILDPHTAFQMTAILEGAVSRGTGTRVKEILPGVPVAGKTGTTNEEKDAWFVGYTPNLVVGVFIGYDTPRPMGKGRTGGALAAPIVGQFMKMAFADKRPVPFRLPDGIKVRSVNAKTGLRLGDDRTDAIQEYFKPFEEPDDAFSAIGVQGGQDGAFLSNDQLQQQRGLTLGRAPY
ncbi:MAG: Penicillin-binding protein : Penicillin-insensitive transglycosylase, partial [Pseudomonadota bacterium]